MRYLISLHFISLVFFLLNACGRKIDCGLAMERLRSCHEAALGSISAELNSELSQTQTLCEQNLEFSPRSENFIRWTDCLTSLNQGPNNFGLYSCQADNFADPNKNPVRTCHLILQKSINHLPNELY